MVWVPRGEFGKLWVGQLVSMVGSSITSVALPLVAVVTLQAAPWEMGLLSALTVLPHLVFGLPAGLVARRWSLRWLLVVGDVGRAVVLGSIPAAAVLGVLDMWQLYAVAVLTGVLTLLADTASQTLTPALVQRTDLMRANSALMLNANVASTVGPSAAGLLVQLATAPFAILFDAASYVVSAVASYRLREPGRTPTVDTERVRLTTGLRVLFGDRLLGPLAVSATLGALFGAMQGPLVVLYLVRELHWSPAYVGVALTTSGVAAVVGTLLAPAWSRRVGIGPSYLSGQFLAALSGAALATALTPVIYLGKAVSGLGMALYGVPQRTLRQSLIPTHHLAQCTATWRTLVIGGQALGAALAGLLATTLGLRPTLLLATLGTLTAVLVAALSPLRRTIHLP
ncbi:MFS transporter [Kribbella sandramycini]|uniref:MFS family permease n=1 Tax=Kribbella sandramycini TaxID=60450 RepID=A0A7Y4NXI3_9ACTN|nr:MFS transporter [Kribbella sandramycini]MBB6567904.1 MFS family permease [Kribbella sandramycini]NOL39501.1 MFS transporter [Kribbella sandramycini]